MLKQKTANHNQPLTINSILIDLHAAFDKFYISLKARLDHLQEKTVPLLWRNQSIENAVENLNSSLIKLDSKIAELSNCAHDEVVKNAIIRHINELMALAKPVLDQIQAKIINLPDIELCNMFLSIKRGDEPFQQLQCTK